MDATTILRVTKILFGLRYGLQGSEKAAVILGEDCSSIPDCTGEWHNRYLYVHSSTPAAEINSKPPRVLLQQQAVNNLDLRNMVPTVLSAMNSLDVMNQASMNNDLN
jgi:hypothetical protein